MVEVNCKYYNAGKGKKSDYFIFTDIEVKGHATNVDFATNKKICAGISAICYGIKDLVDTLHYHYEIASGYFHCWTNFDYIHLDKNFVYALNTIVCQLFTIYKQYPNAFKSFDLIDIKE